MARKKEEFSRYDAADNLKTDEDAATYLEACMDEAGDDAAYVAAALGDVARARGMGKIAKDTGLTRAGLYKALSADGNPSLGTVLKVVKALGVRLTVHRPKLAKRSTRPLRRPRGQAVRATARAT